MQPPPRNPGTPAARNRIEQPPPQRGLRRLVLLFLVVLVLVGLASVASFEYAYMPPLRAIANPDRNELPAYDVWGQAISHQQAEELLATEDGRAFLSDANWAIRIDDELLRLGREVFYKETFGNEIFLTDVLGTLDGAIRPLNVALAVVALAGRGTNDLQVRLAEDVIIGDRVYRAGDRVSTGLDVPRGTFAVMGMKMRYERGRIMAGITCALCHSTVDTESGLVLEGITNPNLNMGLLLAMGTNPAAYFARTDVDLNEHPELFDDPGRTVTLADGSTRPLPNPAMLNDLVREVFINWPPGNFDTMIDLDANPTRTPDVFTHGEHPFGWTGFASIGPFRGINSLSNNVHAFNADPSIEIHMAPTKLDLEMEVYAGTLLQNAAHGRYRYEAGSGESPLDFMKAVDPRPETPGFGHTQHLPTYPGATALAPHSVLMSRHGYPVWHHINALSAFQESLIPPTPPIEPRPEMLTHGRQVFATAGCAQCHSGPAFSNHRVLPVGEIGTEPLRGTGMAKTREIFRRSQIYPMDAIVPVDPDTPVVDVPYGHLTTDQDIGRSLGHDDVGGYKVKGLIGLYWHAPYLHMGDVAVGPDATRDLGVPGTLLSGRLPDPSNSLRALVDRELRARVIDANRGAPSWDMGVRGIGHEFWVDTEAGFSAEDQDALLHYLLLLGHHREARPPDAEDAAASR
jgi:hypothetical protein